jgi:hypothetical protein
MSVSPFKLLNESELLQIKSSLQQSVDRWRGEWFGDSVEAGVAAMPASQLPPGMPGASEEASQARSLGEEKWVAAFAGRRFAAVLAAALGDGGSSGSVLAEQPRSSGMPRTDASPPCATRSSGVPPMPVRRIRRRDPRFRCGTRCGRGRGRPRPLSSSLASA